MRAVSIINRVGGKVRLAKKLLSLFPPHKCYVEAFGGGGALFFTKEPSEVEVLNDIDSDLINLYNVVRFHPNEFNEELTWAIRSREVFENPDVYLPKVTDVHRAVRYYLRIMASFAALGKQFGYWRVRRAVPFGRDWIALSERLQGSHVIIENLDFRDVLRRYDSKDTFFYLDPPYEGTATPYPGKWTHKDTQDLVAGLEAIKGKFLLSWGGQVKLRFKRKVFVKKLRSFQSIAKAQKRPPVTELAIGNYPLKCRSQRAARRRPH